MLSFIPSPRLLRRAWLPLLAIAIAVPALAAAPKLQALAGWQVGSWQRVAGSATTRVCLRTPGQLLVDNQGEAGSCRFTVIRDSAAAASVTYQCDGKRQGRTDLRRDTADVYTLYAQGVTGKTPFAGRSEWRRLGGC